MHFLAPELLWLLLAVPLLVAAYLQALKRKRKDVVRLATLDTVKAALGPTQRMRRHVPPALLLLAIVAAIVAIARPTAVITLPSNQQTLVMAMDVSLSMSARDVEPNRITAAQAAARAFVDEIPPNVRIGIVSFGATAALVQAPTQDREELVAAIDRFQLQRGTATGSALLVSLGTLFPDAGYDLESLVFPGGLRSGGRGMRAELPKKPEGKEVPVVPPGSYRNGAIVLMSDGRRTTGPDPLDIARMAADRGVRVFTVGFGTAEGGSIGFEGWSAYVRLDEETLKAIAAITHGEYFQATSAQELKKVYEGLNAKLVMERKDTEVSALWVAVAALIAVLSMGLSILWFNRAS